MDNDLISRQAAVYAVDEMSYAFNVKTNAHMAFIKALADLPSAERHGRWIRTGEDGYCSVCKCDMPMFRNDWEWEYTETPYCPNCGAEMDGEEE